MEGGLCWVWGPVHQQPLSCPTCACEISAHPEQSVPVLLGEVLLAGRCPSAGELPVLP